MDCFSLLKAQQQDFCCRLNKGNILICKQNNLHGESCILPHKLVETINLESVSEAQKIVDSNLFELENKNIFNLLFYRNLAKESFLYQFEELVQEDKSSKSTNSLSTLNSYNFITKKYKQKLLIKSYYGRLNELEITLTPEEIKNNQIFVFCFFLEEIYGLFESFNPIFIGFIDNNFNKKNRENISLNIQDLYYIGGLNYFLNNFSPSQPPQQYFIAKNYLSKGDYHQGEKILSEVIDSEILEDKIFFLRGVCQYFLDDKDKALKDISQAINLNPHDSLAYHWQGKIYQDLKLYAEAVSSYNHEIKLDSLNFFAYFQRAFTQTKLRNFIDALEDYTIAININPLCFQVYYNRGYLYFLLGDKQSAIKDYCQAINIKSDLYQAHYNLAIIYQELGKYQEAIKEYEKAIKINPKHLKSYYNLAILFSNLGMFNKAGNYYKQALKIDPEFIQCSFNYKALVEMLKNEGNLVLSSYSDSEDTPPILTFDAEINNNTINVY